MVASAEKRLLWHPRRENRFVVGGASQITLYEWRPEAPEIRHVASQHDLQLMKCFAWSPDPVFDDLIAVGLSTGRVDLMRLEATKYARDNVLSSGPCVSLPVRSSRSCNALAFSPVDPNYLAVGLDKVRGDSSLVIWDISTATPTLSFNDSAASTSTIDPTIAKTSRTKPLIPRAEFSSKTDTRIVQQHAPTEIVSSLTFLAQSNSLLWAGISNRWLRLFDLRTAVPATTNVASKVQGIVTDPYEPNRIGTFCDGVVSIWDSRRLPHPLVTFTEKDASADGSRSSATPPTFTTLEFSSVRRGVLATLERDSAYVRFWDLQEAQPIELMVRERSRDSSHSSSGRVGGGRLSWANPTSMLSWTSSTGSNLSSGDVKEPVASIPTSNIILSDTRKTKDFSSSLVSFALVPNAREHPITSNVMVVNKEGDLQVYAVHDTPNHSRWSNYGDLTMAIGTSYRVFSGFSNKGEGTNPWDVLQLPLGSRENSGGKATEQANPDKRLVESDHMLPVRGRSQSMVSPPTFGRGDEDGFPALNASLDVAIPATISHSSRPATRTPVNEDATIKLSNAHRNASFSRALSSLAMRSLDHDEKPLVKSQTSGEQEATGSSSVDKLASQRSQSSPRPHHLSHHRNSKNKQNSAFKNMRHVIIADISMIMRRRALKGYGVGNLAHNSVISNEDPILSELWLWFNYSRHLLHISKPRIHGYDFSCHGLLGIWEGFPASPPTRRAHDIVPPPSPVAGLKSLFTENQTSDLGQLSGRSYSRQGSSRRHSHLLADTSVVNGGATHSAGGQQDDFVLAVSALSAKHDDDTTGPDPWKPATPTSRLVQRRFALQLCGWSLREDELNNAVRMWESENKHSQAACWLVFTKQYHRAVELLMRSKDESHYLISGTLAALTPQNTGSGSGTRSNPDLRQHCERLVLRLHDPYLRAMLTHLTANDWSEVLDEESIPLRERLAVALQFLDDKSLSSYLRRIAETASHRGDISGIIVTGLTSAGIDILQSYVDITGDVQTAAILSCFRCASSAANGSRFNGKEDAKKVVIERWVETYQDLLDGWKMFYYRCQFDIERGTLVQDALRDGDVPSHAEWVPRQIMIRCNFCSKNIDVANSKSRGTNACPNCGRGLPRCSICLMTMTIAPDHIRDASLMYARSRDTINDAIVFCQTCRHGGHASHIIEWFFGEGAGCGETRWGAGGTGGGGGGRAHAVCPIADCDCHCANEL